VGNTHNFSLGLEHRNQQTMKHLVLLASSILLVFAATSAQTTAPPGGGAARPLARDQHDGLTLSADAYTDSARAKAKFPKANPYPVGILPVEVFLSNDTDQPLQFDVSTMQLEVVVNDGKRQALDWLTLREVADAITHPKGPSAPTARRFPIGIPMPGKDKKLDQVVDDLRPFSLDAEIVPPKGAIHGFLFFDVSHDMSLADKASLYMPDVIVVGTKKPLIFFEVPLGRTPAP
jgi:hypothetical protein